MADVLPVSLMRLVSFLAVVSFLAIVSARPCQAGPAQPRARSVRHGTEKGSETLGGRRVEVTRPRARTLDGHELPLQAYSQFAADDLLSQVVLERMLAGVATRQHARIAEPIGKAVLEGASSTGRSAVSRRLVKQTETALAELLARDLTTEQIKVLMLDGEHMAGRCVIVALAITADGSKLPRQGSSVRLRGAAGPGSPKQRAAVGRPDRGVLGQRDGRVVLRHAHERADLPAALADPSHGSRSNDRLDRGPTTGADGTQPSACRHRSSSRPPHDTLPRSGSVTCPPTGVQCAGKPARDGNTPVSAGACPAGSEPPPAPRCVEVPRPARQPPGCADFDEFMREAACDRADDQSAASATSGSRRHQGR